MSERVGVVSRPVPRVLARRPGQAWDAHEVAAHLYGCKTSIIRGLSRRHPWSGIDDETLEGLFDEAVATVARIGASGQRPQWRRPRDLERAAVAAWRHGAMRHHRTVGAEKRRSNLHTAEFDPDRDGALDDPVSAIFHDQDTGRRMTRDWLAELPAPQRGFWKLVLDEDASYNAAGAKLGMNAAQIKKATRDGMRHLRHYAHLLQTDRVCAYRATAILAVKAGERDPDVRERAAAHLECCLPCALIHDRQASAIKRGLAAVLPLPALLRLAGRLREGAEALAPAATAGGAAKLAVTGAATIGAVGAGVGIHDTAGHHHPPARHAAPHAIVAHQAATTAPDTPVTSAPVTPAPLPALDAAPSTDRPAKPTGDRPDPDAEFADEAQSHASGSTTTPATAGTASDGGEFSTEHSPDATGPAATTPTASAPVPAPTPAPSSRSSVPDEFGAP